MPQTSTANRFRAQRHSRGWSLPELARRCADAGAPIDDGNLSRIERGHQVPRPALRKVLSELLELDVSYFDRVAS
jgi:transcriptional regulator with XRE-family HTH domain